MHIWQSLLPQAIAWAKAQSQTAELAGKPLDEAESIIANRVGVIHPERVRVCLVSEIPAPTDQELQVLANQLGLLGGKTVGITLGYTILISTRSFSHRVLSHELRHVSQFEKAGSISEFLTEYIRQIVQFGYKNAPLELDARSHEFEIY